MGRPTVNRLATLRKRLAAKFRAWADRLDPPPVTEIDRLMPLARAAVAQVSAQPVAGSIKWLLALKLIERQTGRQAKRRHINAAIDRAVLEARGEAA